MKTFSEYLEESMTQTLPLLFKTDKGSELTYEYKTKSGRNLSLRYFITTPQGLTALNFQFDVNMNISNTGHNEPLSIFATVIENLANVFKDKKADYVIFGLDPGRERIYSKLLKKNRNKGDISVYSGTSGNIKTMLIMNNKTMDQDKIDKVVSGYHIEGLKKII